MLSAGLPVYILLASAICGYCGGDIGIIILARRNAVYFAVGGSTYGNRDGIRLAAGVMCGA